MSTGTEGKNTSGPCVYCFISQAIIWQRRLIILLTCENAANFARAWMNHRQRRWEEMKAELHWRSLFRTSNRQRFSQQSAGLQGDGVVISWQRGAGHVGTTQADIKDARPWEYWLYTHAFWSCLWHLFLVSASFSNCSSRLFSAVCRLAHTYS